MKISWGTGIVLVLVGFISFIMYFFIKGHYVQQVNLVTEDYYDQGLLHEERNEWKQNANELGTLEFQSNEQGVLLTWPEGVNTAATGEILFSRPNDSKFDVSVAVNINELNQQLVPAEKLMLGNYRIKVKVEVSNKVYYWEDSFTYVK